MLWREVAEKFLLVGRDLEQWHRTERIRGPIAAIDFTIDGLVLTTEWSATSFELEDNGAYDWEDAGSGSLRVVIPKITRETPLSGPFEQPLRLRESLDLKVVVHALNQNIKRPRVRVA